MNTDAEWNELKGRIKSRFGKLSNVDINGLNGHMETLYRKVQKAYAYTDRQTEIACKSFNDSLAKNMSR